MMKYKIGDRVELNKGWEGVIIKVADSTVDDNKINMPYTVQWYKPVVCTNKMSEDLIWLIGTQPLPKLKSGDTVEIQYKSQDSNDWVKCIEGILELTLDDCCVRYMNGRSTFDKLTATCIQLNEQFALGKYRIKPEDFARIDWPVEPEYNVGQHITEIATGTEYEVLAVGDDYIVINSYRRLNKSEIKR
jgi:hypothetical protein